MGNDWKWGYMKVIYVRYSKAKDRKEKTQILDEFCKTYKCHRKHALRLLNAPPPGQSRPGRKRSLIYTKRIISIIEYIWKASGYPWSKRLKAIIKLWMPSIQQRFSLTDKERQQLLSISPAQIDRRLKSKKQWIRKKVYGSTKPGAILKHQIPVKTDSWDIKTPGFVEVDLVSHCGGSAFGQFAYTVNWTDISTQWVERRAVPGKGQYAVFNALVSMPFKLKGLDSDNGSEFINDHLLRYCLTSKIRFTRSREYKKDDNAHVEQKNYTHVRQLLGYLRYDTETVIDKINQLYQHELRIFQNFFQPSVKLVKKHRIGSKIKKIYDEPKTPFQRLIASGKGNKKTINHFRNISKQFNPFELSNIIELKLSKIYDLASKTPKHLMPTLRFHNSPYPATPPNAAFHSHLLPKSPVPDYLKIYQKEKDMQSW